MLGEYVRHRAIERGFSNDQPVRRGETQYSQTLLSAEHAAMFWPLGSNLQLRISDCARNRLATRASRADARNALNESPTS